MNKKRLKLFLFVLCMATYQHAFAHGSGGNGSSYNFDKNDLSAEKKQDEDTWADFMKAVNTPSNEDHSEKSHDHGDSASTE